MTFLQIIIHSYADYCTFILPLQANLPHLFFLSPQLLLLFKTRTSLRRVDILDTPKPQYHVISPFLELFPLLMVGQPLDYH